MKILYAGMMYDYGIRERGFSFEHYNFYDTLVNMGHEVEYFDFMSLYQVHGSKVMTEMLRTKVDQVKPELLFTFLFTNEFDAEILSKITSETSTITFNWFADDHWRFDSFSRHWAGCFRFISTTDRKAVEKYRSIGYSNALLSQWGVNHFRYRRQELPLNVEVSFIGQAHGKRGDVVRSLIDHGIPLTVKGGNWDIRRYHIYLRKLRLISESYFQSIANRTRITQEEMIALFSQSRVNLNLTASSDTSFPNQIKGRNFEIPGCGGFQLSEYAEHLDEYFTPEKEIVCFRSEGEMLDKIRYYLAHENERIAIAEAGYQRTLRDHTYEKRFNELFRQMGLV
ncbi:MAG: CgeB family protein [Bacteroidota bacterium]